MSVFKESRVILSAYKRSTPQSGSVDKTLRKAYLRIQSLRENSGKIIRRQNG